MNNKENQAKKKNIETQTLQTKSGETKFASTLPKNEIVENELQQDIFLDEGNEFSDLQLEDYTWKVIARKNYGKILVALLILQNIAVFGMVIYALVYEKIGDLQIVFGVLIAATLTETAYMVKVIVEWMFKDINYPRE